MPETSASAQDIDHVASGPVACLPARRRALTDGELDALGSALSSLHARNERLQPAVG
ncbi:hypothetical protein [Streptomyces sp. BK79]|uniref:hypothetical protein n=1 Tax=Streptomyces sp. BK79 TaxID=3350097 RepID=UPI0037702581